MRFVCVHVVHPYISTNTAVAVSLFSPRVNSIVDTLHKNRYGHWFFTIAITNSKRNFLSRSVQWSANSPAYVQPVTNTSRRRMGPAVQIALLRSCSLPISWLILWINRPLLPGKRTPIPFLLTSPKLTLDHTSAEDFCLLRTLKNDSFIPINFIIN